MDDISRDLAPQDPELYRLDQLCEAARSMLTCEEVAERSGNPSTKALVGPIPDRPCLYRPRYFQSHCDCFWDYNNDKFNE